MAEEVKENRANERIKTKPKETVWPKKLPYPGRVYTVSVKNRWDGTHYVLVPVRFFFLFLFSHSNLVSVSLTFHPILVLCPLPP